MINCRSEYQISFVKCEKLIILLREPRVDYHRDLVCKNLSIENRVRAPVTFSYHLPHSWISVDVFETLWPRARTVLERYLAGSTTRLKKVLCIDASRRQRLACLVVIVPGRNNIHQWPVLSDWEKGKKN